MIVFNYKFVKVFTFGFAKAITLYPYIFLKYKKDINNKVLINHESIHSVQQKEMLILFFHLWYIIEYLIKTIKYGKDSYFNISFERESKYNEYNYNYLKDRKRYSWIKYIFKN